MPVGFDEESEVDFGMGWFYTIVTVAVIAGLAVAVSNISDIFGHRTLQAIVALSVMVICVALVKLVSKLHD